MKFSKKLLILAIVLAVAALCCACGGAGGDQNASVKDSVKVQIASEPDTLDPHQSMALGPAIITKNLNGFLVKQDNEGNMVGDLAESWTVNDDFTVYTFQMKDGIKFSDGTPITAKDVEFSYNRCLKINFGIAYFNYIKSVVATSDKEVVITLNQPYSVFLPAMTGPGFAILSQKAIEGGMDVAKLPNVTSGPYYVEAWNTGSDIVLKANPNYYDGEAAIKTVDCIIMADENTALMALQAGDIDFMTGGTGAGISASSITTLQGLDTYYLLPYDSTQFTFLSLNQNVKYFADLNVRKAIDCAINRDDIITSAYDGYAIPAGIPALPSIGGYVDGYSATAYDVAAAKKYLAASAYPNGFTFTMEVYAPWMKTAQVIQANLAEIGITAELKQMEVGAIISDMFGNNYEAGLMSWSNASGDVTNVAPMYTAGNPNCMGGLKDKTIGQLFDKSVTVVGDERNQVLTQAYDKIVADTPYIALIWPKCNYAAAKGLVLDTPIDFLGIYRFYGMHWEQ